MLGPVVCDIVGTTLSEIEKRRIAHPLVGMVILFARNYENRTQLEKLCRAIHDIKPGVLICVDLDRRRINKKKNEERGERGGEKGRGGGGREGRDERGGRGVWCRKKNR